MSILAKHIEFVKEQSTFHARRADNSFKGKLHSSTSDKFNALLSDLEAADKVLDTPSPQVSSINAPKKIQLSLTIEDIEGLPEELLLELSLSDRDKTEFAIVNAIEEAGGIISLDKLLIALYRKTGEIHKRNSLYSKLSRMASKSQIYYVPGKKGVYSTELIKAEDANNMFGVNSRVIEGTEELEEDDLVG